MEGTKLIGPESRESALLGLFCVYSSQKAHQSLVVVFYKGAIKAKPSTSETPAGSRAPLDELASSCSVRQVPDMRAPRLTSSSIFASAISCSLPLPFATFCASAIWARTASALKSSRGYASTALMLRAELGWTTAKPPDTVARLHVSCHVAASHRPQAHPPTNPGPGQRTEELLAAAALLDNLDQAGLQLLNGGDVVGEDTHLSRLGGQVDLDNILGLVDGLQC